LKMLLESEQEKEEAKQFKLPLFHLMV